MLGPWWDMRIQHAIPIVIFNALSLLWFIALSLQLFKVRIILLLLFMVLTCVQVYKHQSFSRVGASPQIHKVYKVSLRFFVLPLKPDQVPDCALVVCSIAVGAVLHLGDNSYLDRQDCEGQHPSDRLPLQDLSGGFHRHCDCTISMLGCIPDSHLLQVELPWIVLGWISVRRECRIMFCFFALISMILFGISTALFCSPRECDCASMFASPLIVLCQSTVTSSRRGRSLPR